MSDNHAHHDETFKVCVIKSDLREAELPKQAILADAKRFQFSESATFAIKLALEEALVNAVKHGNCCDLSKRVVVLYNVNEDMLEVIIRDEGAGFEPERVPDCTAPERLPLPNGRGIMLLRAYMDKVEYRNQGREVYLMKRRVPGADEGESSVS